MSILHDSHEIVHIVGRYRQEDLNVDLHMDLYKFYKWTEVQFFNLYGERDGEGEGSLAKENKERVFIRGGGKHNNAIQFLLF